MKNFFTIFSLSVLIILEICMGNLGIFFPIFALGIIYFSQNNSKFFMLVTALIASGIIDFALYHRILPLNFLIYLLLIMLQKPYRHIINKGLLINSLVGGVVFCGSYLICLGIFFPSNWDLITDVMLFTSTVLFSFVMGFISMFILLSCLEGIAEKLKLPLFFHSTYHSHNRNIMYRGKR